VSKFFSGSNSFPPQSSPTYDWESILAWAAIIILVLLTGYMGKLTLKGGKNE
jgi:hypothetical protein